LGCLEFLLAALTAGLALLLLVGLALVVGLAVVLHFILVVANLIRRRGMFKPWSEPAQ
jgi:hypothetical protein